ncbi:SHOCT domain-containing protein [uncultured Xylophilus sp.]|uniref:SHOCT domain-containing protein n=1 Tax=uncultured Xylophilus sp. TaxID=296832 RepID=UPI0025E658E7|nr:SHOCT domain-containing protein [uncultured Xylophilus sp.]
MQLQSQLQHSSTLPVPAPALATPDDIGRQHGFGEEAAAVLWEAVVRGGGRMAQFSHPELGGSGQWMRNGMVMVGDMLNTGLSARVASTCEDLAQWLDAHPDFAEAHGGDVGTADRWWPHDFGTPATSGGQNGVRYAWFPTDRRLAIERNGSVELHDTQDHVIGGVSQQQGGADGLAFTSQRGPVSLEALPRVQGAGPSTPAPHPRAADTPRKTAASTSAHDDVLATIDRLSELHQRGVLTDEEFGAKKADLLARL